MLLDHKYSYTSIRLLPIERKQTAGESSRPEQAPHITRDRHQPSLPLCPPHPRSPSAMWSRLKTKGCCSSSFSGAAVFTRGRFEFNFVVHVDRIGRGWVRRARRRRIGSKLQSRHEHNGIFREIFAGLTTVLPNLWMIQKIQGSTFFPHSTIVVCLALNAAARNLYLPKDLPGADPTTLVIPAYTLGHAGSRYLFEASVTSGSSAQSSLADIEVGETAIVVLPSIKTTAAPSP